MHALEVDTSPSPTGWLRNRKQPSSCPPPEVLNFWFRSDHCSYTDFSNQSILDVHVEKLTCQIFGSNIIQLHMIVCEAEMPALRRPYPTTFSESHLNILYCTMYRGTFISHLDTSYVETFMETQCCSSHMLYAFM